MTDTVRVSRNNSGEIEVVAIDVVGRVIASRTYKNGSNREAWALEQARRYADKFSLWFDSRTCYAK